jgi:hypothetical protein
VPVSDRGRPGSLDERFAAALRPYIPTLIITVGASGTGYWYATNWREIYVASLLMFARFGMRVDADLMMGLLAALFFMLGAAAVALAGIVRTLQARESALPPRAPSRP